MPDFTLLAASQAYVTEAQGDPPGPPYFNAAVAGLWQGAPEDLLDRCQAIEADLGRTRPYVNAPRSIDIDLLFWEGRTIETPRLSVPHPRLGDRAFALVPLLELEPHLALPDGRPLASRLTASIMTQGIRTALPDENEGPSRG